VIMHAVLAVAWAGAGRSSISPLVVHSISAIATVLFVSALLHLARTPPPETTRRPAARVLRFRPREERYRAIASPPTHPMSSH